MILAFFMEYQRGIFGKLLLGTFPTSFTLL
jgi:hypothetical protein